MKRTALPLGATALALTLSISPVAHAQEPATAPAAAPAAEPAPAASGSASMTAGGAMTLPTAPAPAATAQSGDSDHDMVVGTLGIGYMGRRDMAVGGQAQRVSSQVIGARYWIDPTIGIDAGIGIGIGSASPDPLPSTTAFMIHGGVPIALASSGHFTFQVIPELNVGFASFSSTSPGGDTSGSGFHFDIGARAGAEIHFGFIGLPKLSLQGTIGLGFATESQKLEPPGGPNTKTSTTLFGTSVQDAPWNIFTSNVAALYYF